MLGQEERFSGAEQIFYHPNSALSGGFLPLPFLSIHSTFKFFLTSAFLSLSDSQSGFFCTGGSGQRNLLAGVGPRFETVTVTFRDEVRTSMSVPGVYGSLLNAVRVLLEVLSGH